jgi:hypothetical protein
VYGGKCAVSGWKAVAALEAAHIQPIVGQRPTSRKTAFSFEADIHTLFDLGLIRLTDQRRIEIHSSLKSSEYRRFDGRAEVAERKEILAKQRCH